jgi:hypothetical protein
MTPTISMIPPGAAGVHSVRTGEHIAASKPQSLLGRKRDFPEGAATQPSFCPSHLLSDKDDYKELLGAVDNAFLVAYAIGMFIR